MILKIGSMAVRSPDRECPCTLNHNISRTYNIFIALPKAVHSCRITCERSECGRDQRIALYKSDPQQQQQLHFVWTF